MRMGITERARKLSKTQPVLQPKKSSDDDKDSGAQRNLTIGRIESNLIEVIYTPLLVHIAERQSEEYADLLLEYEDSLKEQQQQQEGNEYDTNELDSILDTTSEPLPPPPSISTFLYATHYNRDELTSQILLPTVTHFTTPLTKKRYADAPAQWKIHANAAKFERLLDEKYGRLRPFLTQHPEIEIFIRTTQRRIAKGEFGCSVLRQGDPPMDAKASIILLFLLHRNGVRWEVMVLSVLFLLVGLQPWALVSCVAFGRWFVLRRRRRMSRGWLLNGKDEVKVVEPYYAKETRQISGDEDAIRQAKYDHLLKPVGQPISTDNSADYFTTTTDMPNKKQVSAADNDEDEDEKYDTLLVGSGPATLYTAALLSRTGRTVLVLSPEKDASGASTITDDTIPTTSSTSTFKNVPFDIEANNVAHTSRQQSFLAAALCTDTDAQGGIRFARIGTEADGYTSDLLSIPGMGSDANDDGSGGCVPFPLRAGGVPTLAQDAALFLNDGWPTEEGTEHNKTVGNSLSAAYFDACATINATASQYYVTKSISSNNSASNTPLSPITKKITSPTTSYQECSIRYASAFADRILPLNPHLRSLVAGMGMRGENLPPGKTSLGAHITNVCAVAGARGEGFTYPVGGPRALCHALGCVVEQNGGKIVTGARVKEFLFREEEQKEEKVKEKEVVAKKVNTKKESDADDDDTKEDKSKLVKPRCYGVKLTDDRTISVGTHEDSVVISMKGFIQTFIFNMAPDIREKYGIPSGLPALSERRPLLHFLIGLKGDSTELNLTGADWYRLPGASLARDEMNPVTGEVKLGTVGADLDDDADWEVDDATNVSTNNNADGIDNSDSTITITKSMRDKRAKKSKKTRRNKFTSGTSWIKVSFPSAKDPSFHQRHPNMSTCVVTVEADDDFVTPFDTSPKIYSNANFGTGELTRLFERVVTKDLMDNFPQLEGKVDCYKMVGPVRMGLSHTPHRYAASGIRPGTGYPGLYVGGSDLTVGDSFSASIIGGWMAANAVMKYNFVDHMFLQKTITSDLAQFLTSPKIADGGVEDIAVPFEQQKVVDEVKENKVDEVAQTNHNDELTAESTKEE